MPDKWSRTIILFENSLCPPYLKLVKTSYTVVALIVAHLKHIYSRTSMRIQCKNKEISFRYETDNKIISFIIFPDNIISWYIVWNSTVMIVKAWIPVSTKHIVWTPKGLIIIHYWDLLFSRETFLRVNKMSKMDRLIQFYSTRYHSNEITSTTATVRILESLSLLSQNMYS